MRTFERAGFPRIGWVLAVLAALASARESAGDDGVVLRPDESPRTMLYRALEAQAHERLEARRKEVAALETADGVRERQTRIRAKFLEGVGELPDKTPLNARVVGSDKRDGYRVERVIYESRPGHHVTANLYLPDCAPKYPGVLLPCGHSANGKAAEAYQRACILLARSGMAVLCYDPFGQGERLQALGEDGKSLTGGSTTEHTMAGIGALLVGRSAAGYRIWDGIRSLDYLASRPEVDPTRLGCTGNSGGGTMTAYLMALDERIAAAVPSCYITSLSRLFATIGPQDAEQNITGQVAFGMDHADYAILRAPKPTLFSVGTRDFFDIQGSWDTFREVKLVYGRLGFGERIDLFESDEPHGFTRPRRQAAARWLSRWLLKKDEPIVEPEFTIATDAQLQCTETGQVLSALKGKSIFDLNAERSAELAHQRSDDLSRHDKDAILAKVRELIALREPIKPAKRGDRATIKRDGYTVQKLVFETEPGIMVPGRLIQPDRKAEDKHLTIVLGGPQPRSRTAEQRDEELSKREVPLLVLDLRGMGETTPDAKSPFGADWKEAFLGLHLGRPLIGQRVTDLLSVIAALSEQAGESRASGQRTYALEAYGPAAPVALHAAALAPSIASLDLNGMLTSWTDLVRTPVSRDQLANVVPGALASYDLPDLAALIAPRPLRIRGMADPEGRAVAQERIEAAYARCKMAYARHDPKALTIQAGPTVPTLSSPVQTVDLSIGETRTVILANGRAATVKLIGVDERRDPIRSAVREGRARVEINGIPLVLNSGNYQLPITAGAVQVDCPITGGYRSNSNEDPWALEKDARIRLWSAGSPWIDPVTFTYPLKQRWFASSTQMANEPVYVDGGEKPSVTKIYYHYGLDIGGAEGMAEVVAATDGLVVSSGTELLPGFEKTPARPRYDVVYILDDRGWYYRYSHMQRIDPAIKPGATVRLGQRIGVLGKEGGSGGWSHLHFEIRSPQPSGRFGIQEGYAFLWQANERAHKPEIVAVARPHRLARVGEPVVLDGSRSRTHAGPVASHEWTFSDGTTATGPRVERVYARPGSYSEILKVTDRHGHFDYDFAIVQVQDRSPSVTLPPTIHAAYAPTAGIKPGQPVTFKVRTFRTTEGRETWDFGDGSPPVTVRSDGNVDQHAKDGYAVTEHRYEKPGHYLVRVERADDRGVTATARLHVFIEGTPGE